MRQSKVPKWPTAELVEPLTSHEPRSGRFSFDSLENRGWLFFGCQCEIEGAMS